MNVDLDRIPPAVIGRLVHLAGGISLGIAIVAYLYMVDLPFQDHLKRKSNRIASLQTKLNKKDAQLTRECQLTAKLETIETKLKQWQLRVPENSEVDRFLNDAGKLARKHDIKILDFRPGLSQSEENFTRLDIQVNASGRYRDYCRFLDSLERLDRLNQIRNLSVTATGDECQFSMSVSIYQRQSSDDLLFTSASR